jgi:hypothetical protein
LKGHDAIPFHKINDLKSLSVNIIQVRITCAVREKPCALIAQLAANFPKKASFLRWYVNCIKEDLNCGQHVCCPERSQRITTTKRRNAMKIKQLLTLCGIAAGLFFSAGSIFAQNNDGGNGGGPGGGGRGNFDPAQFQQRMMERIHDQLDFTNDTDWNAVQPLVQKVMDAQRDARSGGMGRMFGGRNRGSNNGGQGGTGGGRGMFGGTPSPEAEALQKAIDDNSPSTQIKELLTKYQASQKAKQAKLVAAQSDLRAVLTVKQEAQATLLGLIE